MRTNAPEFLDRIEGFLVKHGVDPSTAKRAAQDFSSHLGGKGITETSSDMEIALVLDGSDQRLLLGIDGVIVTRMEAVGYQLAVPGTSLGRAALESTGCAEIVSEPLS